MPDTRKPRPVDLTYRQRRMLAAAMLGPINDPLAGYDWFTVRALIRRKLLAVSRTDGLVVTAAGRAKMIALHDRRHALGFRGLGGQRAPESGRIVAT
jgi:hypothetical protein